MSKNPNDLVGDGSNVHPQRDNDSAIVPSDRSRGLELPPPGRHCRCMARPARGPVGNGQRGYNFFGQLGTTP